MTHRRGISAYQEAQANEYDQAELIMMMFSGAVNFLTRAIETAETDKHRMREYVSRAKKILLEIMCSLNLEKGGEVGKLLLDTYSRQYRSLHQAQMTDDVRKLSAIRDSIAEIGNAWREVFRSEEYQVFKRTQRGAPQHASISR